MIICGIGEILYSVWSIIQGIMYVLLNMNKNETLISIFEYENESVFSYFLQILFFGIFFIVVATSILLPRIYVGICAFADGHGKRKSPVYLFIAVFLNLMTILYIIWGIVSFGKTTYDIIDIIIQSIIKATSLWVMTDLIVSAVKLRRIRAEGQA